MYDFVHITKIHFKHFFSNIQIIQCPTSTSFKFNWFLILFYVIIIMFHFHEWEHKNVLKSQNERSVLKNKKLIDILSFLSAYIS